MSFLGVSGSITLAGGPISATAPVSASFPCSDFAAATSFPASAPPSVSAALAKTRNGNADPSNGAGAAMGEEQQQAEDEKTLNSYVATDAYTSSLIPTNNGNASSNTTSTTQRTATAASLLQLTHALAAARAYSDKVLTELLTAQMQAAGRLPAASSSSTGKVTLGQAAAAVVATRNAVAAATGQAGKPGETVLLAAPGTFSVGSNSNSNSSSSSHGASGGINASAGAGVSGYSVGCGAVAAVLTGESCGLNSAGAGNAMGDCDDASEKEVAGTIKKARVA